MSDDELKQALARLAMAHRDQLGGLMPLLHAVQKRYGYIPDICAATVAPIFRLSTAEVDGVISFYHQFKRRPQGKHRVQICRAEACQANGCRSLEQFSKDHLQLDYGESSDDGLISLDSVYCLGLCSHGPAVRVDEELYVQVDNEKMKTIIRELQS